MGNGDHTMSLVRAENARIVSEMKRQYSHGKCDPNACVSGFERIFSLVEMLFELYYERKPAEAPIPTAYVPTSFREAFLIAATKSPWAIATIVAITAVYSMFFGKLINIPWF